MSAFALTTTASPVAAVPPADQVVPVVPLRLLDTRSGVGAPAAKVVPGGTVELTVTGGTTGVPADAAAVALNVTVTEADGNGFVTVWPCGSDRPLASNLNVTTGGTIPNLIIAKVGTAGKVCLFTQPGANLIADLNGFWGEVLPAGQPPTIQGPDIVQSGSAAPSGTATVTGLPVAGAGITPGPEVITLGSAQAIAPPTAEEAASAPAAADATFPMPTMPNSASSSKRTEMLLNEPTYPIGSSGYATTVNKAIGRVVMWTYSATAGWQRASSCSGTVVGPNMVLTAAHCLKSTWNYYSFIPGLYGDSKPGGEWFAPSNRAYAHQAFFDLQAANDPAKVVLDYAFIKFDPQYNNNFNLSDYTGEFQILMQSNLAGMDLYNVGYPVEGFYSLVNGGWCNLRGIWCFPYKCQSTGTGQADFGGGWQMIGFGCDGNGGISGSGVFSLISGTWYVVSVNDYGGDIRDQYGQICPVSQRSVCSWYMRNSWGPEFRQGWLDVLWQGVNNA